MPSSLSFHALGNMPAANTTEEQLRLVRIDDAIIFLTNINIRPPC
jgi:hypothetical protein